MVGAGPSMLAVSVLLAAVMVVLAAMAEPPVMVAPADDWVTTTLWDPVVRPLPVIVEIPYAVPPFATSTGPAAAVAVVLDSVPLVTRAPAVASLSTVNERLPTLAAVVAVAVTAVEL